MRIIISFLFSFLAFAGFSQQVGSLTHNFGKVKEWNNPIFTTTYTNTSGQLQFFLPTNYSPDFRINFEKDMLQPGESKKIKFNINKEKLSFYNANLKWDAEPTDFDLMIGSSSEDLRLKESFELKK